jgi:hypothetical protein
MQQCKENLAAVLQRSATRKKPTNDRFHSLPSACIEHSITLEFPKKGGITAFNSEEETEY